MNKMNNYIVTTQKVRTFEYYADAQSEVEDMLKGNPVVQGAFIAQVTAIAHRSDVAWETSAYATGNDKPTNHSLTWSGQDKRTLARTFRETKGDIIQIAAHLGRTHGSIVAQIDRQLRSGAGIEATGS